MVACSWLLVPRRNYNADDHQNNVLTWQNDYASFVESLRKLSLQGDIPTRTELTKKYDENLCFPITDGAGGFIDLSPLPGTLQFRANDCYSDRKVSWKIRLAHDAFQSPNYLPTHSAVWLFPHPPGTLSDLSDDDSAEVLVLGLLIEQPPQGGLDALKAGEEYILSGQIGDARQTDILLFRGVHVAYHLGSGKSNSIGYIVGLSNTRIIDADLPQMQSSCMNSNYQAVTSRPRRENAQ